MLDFDERVARFDLRVLDDLREIVDRAHRNIVGEQQRLPLLVRLGQKYLLQHRQQSRAVLVALQRAAEAGIVGQVGTAQRRAQLLPQFVARDRNREVARLGMKGLVRHQRRVGVAGGFRNFAIGAKGADHRAEQRKLAFEHGDVDLLAFAGFFFHAQREHDAVGRVKTRRHVGDRHASARAAAAFITRDTDHAAFGLQDKVERRAVAVRAVLAETRDRAVNDAGVALLRLRVIDAEPLQRADAVILDHDVALFEQLEEELLALGLFHIEDDAALVAVQAHEVRRLAARDGHAPAAREIAFARRLYLDQLRAVVGQHGRAKRPRERVREVQHLDVFERQLHVKPCGYF